MRDNVMEPAITENLDRFLASLEGRPEYLLAPAHYNSKSGRSSIGFCLTIQKSELVVRSAWEIGMGDIEAMGLSPSHDLRALGRPTVLERLAQDRETTENQTKGKLRKAVSQRQGREGILRRSVGLLPCYLR